eukprot:PRCOL_00006670-RA
MSPSLAAAAAADAALAALHASLARGARAHPAPAAPGVGRSLALPADGPGAARGAVLLRVPDAAALCACAGGGGAPARVVAPAGAWPRLAAGAAGGACARAPAEVHLARALLDAAAGDGGGAWGEYAEAVLPLGAAAAAALTVPPTAPDSDLALIADGGSIAAEVATERRTLAALGADLGEGGGEALAAAFACARSRALTAGEGWAALVPLVDLANHSSHPAADYRCFGVVTPANARADVEPQDLESFELVALRDLSPGEEVTIRYGGGAAEWTLRRSFCQYGFTEDAQIEAVGDALGGRGVRLCDAQAVARAAAALAEEATAGEGAGAAAAARYVAVGEALAGAHYEALAGAGGDGEGELLSTAAAAEAVRLSAAGAAEGAAAARARAAAAAESEPAPPSPFAAAALAYNERRVAALEAYADVLEAASA